MRIILELRMKFSLYNVIKLRCTFDLTSTKASRN